MLIRVGCVVFASQPSMLNGISVLNHITFKIFLQDVGVSGADSFVVVLFEIDDFEAELFVEFDRTFIVHLDVSKIIET